jgi:hypothetical protein
VGAGGTSGATSPTIRSGRVLAAVDHPVARLHGVGACLGYDSAANHDRPAQGAIVCDVLTERL